MKTSCIAVLLLLTATASFSQVPSSAYLAPSSDVYVGYVTTFPDYGAQYDSCHFSGAEVGYTKNFRPHFSLSASGLMVFGSPYSVKQFSGTVGPKMNLLTGRVRPYITAQAGYVYQSSKRMYAADHHPPLQGSSDTEDGFTYRLGGGLDIELNRKLYWRAIQWDVQPQPWARDTPFYQNWGTGIGYRF